MISTLLLGKFKSFILFVISLFSRVLCCFRKRRRLSCDVEPLAYVDVVSNNEFEKWDNWKDNENFVNKNPSTVEEHIQFYRQQQAAAQQQQVVEVQENFFEDMTPKITKQKKILLTTNEGTNKSNNLSLVPDCVNIVSFIIFRVLKF